MILVIQVLSWDRHNIAAGLNWLMGSRTWFGTGTILRRDPKHIFSFVKNSDGYIHLIFFFFLFIPIGKLQ